MKKVMNVKPSLKHLNKEDLKKSVIMAEVLGKPKAKRGRGQKRIV